MCRSIVGGGLIIFLRLRMQQKKIIVTLSKNYRTLQLSSDSHLNFNFIYKAFVNMNVVKIRTIPRVMN